jgi:type I restriction enzyme, S subunit
VIAATEAAEGVEAATWMGRVPPTWEVARLKYVAKLGTGHTPSRKQPEYWVDEERTIPWVTLADVWQLRDGRQTTITETAEKISEIGLANSAAVLHPAGTVILSRTASVGFSAILGVDAATSQDFMTWTCGPRLEPTYLVYVLRAMKQEFRRLVMGSTHKTIYMPDIERLTIPLPSAEEQREIVRRIEAELVTLDAVVDAKTRLLALLRERRRQTVRNAVFRGIDYDRPLSDAASPLVGTAPSEWQRTRLKYLFESMKNGVWGSDPAGDENDIVCVRVADFDRSRHVVKTDNLTLRSISAADRVAHGLQREDILLEKSGGGEQQPVGEAVLFEHEFSAVCSNFVARLRARSDQEPRFLWYLLTGLYEARANVPFIKQTTGIQNLDAAAFFAQPWNLPEREEQTRIVRYLDAKTDELDRLRRTIDRQRLLLEEHRDTLIFSAVTGRPED